MNRGWGNEGKGQEGILSNKKASCPTRRHLVQHVWGDDVLTTNLGHYSGFRNKRISINESTQSEGTRRHLVQHAWGYDVLTTNPDYYRGFRN
jgi:hypothetical protein